MRGYLGSGLDARERRGLVEQRSVLDGLEGRYPMLRGTIRDQVTGQRRPYVRFFACEQDLSHQSPDAPLPAAVGAGAEPFLDASAPSPAVRGREKMPESEPRRVRTCKGI